MGMNQCEIDGCMKMIDGKCTANNFNPETWKLVGKGNKYTLCYAFTHKPKETPMIQERDCRRCEKYDEEGNCTHSRRPEDKFRPTVSAACPSLTPVQGHDCRNCQRFNGQGQPCGISGIHARTLNSACDDFDPLQTSQPSPTVLTYTDEDEEEVRIVKGDKTLSLENIWASRPCGDEYRKMSVAFTDKGFNPNTEIPFTQENLDLLSDAAFMWLFEGEFFFKAKERVEEKPAYKVGQWFERTPPSCKYLIIQECRPRRYSLLALSRIPGTCYSAIADTEKELSDLIHKEWTDLTPIPSPF